VCENAFRSPCGGGRGPGEGIGRNSGSTASASSTRSHPRISSTGKVLQYTRDDKDNQRTMNLEPQTEYR
jgi:hypothetical protein